jgi:hypothetical protein
MENVLSALLQRALVAFVLLGWAAATYTATRADPQLASCAAEVGYLRRCAAAQLCGARGAKGSLPAAFSHQEDRASASPIIATRG